MLVGPGSGNSLARAFLTSPKVYSRYWHPYDPSCQAYSDASGAVRVSPTAGMLRSRARNAVASSGVRREPSAIVPESITPCHTSNALNVATIFAVNGPYLCETCVCVCVCVCARVRACVCMRSVWTLAVSACA